MKNTALKFLSLSAILAGSMIVTSCKNDSGTTTTSTEEETVYYSISYVTNCDIEITPTRGLEGERIITAMPSRDDYDFVGWYMDEALTEEFTETYFGNGNYTLYAKWEKKTYTVSFISFTEKNPESITYYGGTYVELPTPEMEGYKFLGWYESLSDTEAFDSSIMPKRNVTLYAKWNFECHYIKLVNTLDNSLSYVLAYPKQKVTLPEYSEPYYEFKGWFMDEAGSIAFDPSKTVSTDLTLYGIFEQNKYVFSFESSSDTSEIYAHYGEDVTLPEASMYGMEFLGWTTNKEDESQYVKHYVCKGEDVIFYPVFRIGQGHYISYKTGGGDYISSSYLQKGDSKILPTPSRENYIFKGWYFDEEYSDPVLTDSLTYDDLNEKDMTLYAKWEKEEYTLTFVTNGGKSSVKEMTLCPGETLSIPDPVKTNYTFKGWFMDENLSVPFTLTEMDHKNHTLYAKWEENVYTVTLKYHDGKKWCEKVITGHYGDDISYPNGYSNPYAITEREYCTFLGYKSDANLSDLTHIPSSDITITEDWDIDDSVLDTTFDIYLKDGCAVIYDWAVPDYDDAVVPEYIVKETSDGSLECYYVAKIDDNAFTDNKKITKITFEGEIEIGESAFQDSEIQYLVFKKRATIDGNAFQYCRKLISVSAEDTLNVHSWAFSSCGNLVTASINHLSEEDYEEYAFSGCVKLLEVHTSTEVDITKAKDEEGYQTNYYGGLFSSCKEVLPYGSGNKFFGYEDFLFRYDDDDDKLEFIEYIGTATSVTLPSYVTINEVEKTYSISSYSISGSTIKKLTIPKTVKSFDDDAFADSTMESVLEEVVFEGEDVTYFGSSMFEGQASLKSVTLPKNLTEIPECTFDLCSSLVSVNFPGSVQDGINVTLPETVTTVGRDAFHSTAIVSLCIRNPNLSYEAGFEGMYYLTSLFLPGGMKEIPKDAFMYCSINNLTLPQSLEKIGENAFAKSSIQYLSLPENVSYIGDDAFVENKKMLVITNASALTITLGSDDNGGVAKYAKYIVDDTTDTYSLFVQDGYKFILTKDSLICYGYQGTEDTLAFPSKVTYNKVTYSSYEINSYFIYSVEEKSESFSKIVIPSSVTKIGEGAFEYSSMKEVSFLNASNLVIGDDAFNFCVNLNKVDFGSNAISHIGSRAFLDCGLSTIDLTGLSASVFDGEEQVFGSENVVNSIYRVILPDGFDSSDVASRIIYDAEEPDGYLYWSLIYGSSGEESESFKAFKSLFHEAVTDSSLSSLVNYSDTGLWFFVHEDETATLVRYTGTDTEVWLPSSFKATVKGNSITISSYDIGEKAFYEVNGTLILQMPTSITKIGSNVITYSAVVTVYYEGTSGEYLNLISDIDEEGYIIQRYDTLYPGDEASVSLYFLYSVSTWEAGTEYYDYDEDGKIYERSDTYSLTVEVDGETYSYTCLGNETIEVDALAEAIGVEKDGYIFKGFSKKGSDVILSDFNISNKNYSLVGHYAESHKATITYFNGEKYVTDVIYGAEGDKVLLPDVIDQKYYVFEGWYCNGSIVTDTLCFGSTDLDITEVYHLEDANSFFSFEMDGENVTITGILSSTYDENLTIPDYVVYGNQICKVVAIGTRAFADKTIRTVTFEGSNLTTIGDYAFSGTKIESVTIPSSVSTIGKSAFDRTQLSSLIMSGDCDFSSAFMNLSSLTSVTFADSMTSISKSAFYNCIGLLSITIPENMKSIGDDAFSGCTSLTEVYNLSSLDITAGSSSYGNVAKYAYVVKPALEFESDGFKFLVYNDTCYISGYTGSQTTLNELSFPESVSYGGKNYSDYGIFTGAFINQDKITSITLPDNVTSIGSKAFYNCSGLDGSTFTIPNSVKKISSGAFDGLNLSKLIFASDSTLYDVSLDGLSVSELHVSETQVTFGQFTSDGDLPSRVDKIVLPSYYKDHTDELSYLSLFKSDGFYRMLASSTATEITIDGDTDHIYHVVLKDSSYFIYEEDTTDSTFTLIYVEEGDKTAVVPPTTYTVYDDEGTIVEKTISSYKIGAISFAKNPSIVMDLSLVSSIDTTSFTVRGDPATTTLYIKGGPSDDDETKIRSHFVTLAGTSQLYDTATKYYSLVGEDDADTTESGHFYLEGGNVIIKS